jgi:hypothetical protein
MSNSRKPNSRAVMSSSLVQILVALFVLAAVLIYIITSVTAKADREVCKASVLGQAMAINAPGGEKLITPDCKTYNVVFFNDRVEINGKPAKVYDERKADFTKKFNGLTDQIVNRVLAEEMRGCWYQFLEGNRKIFSSGGLIGGGTQVPYRCFLCDEIRFDKVTVAQEEFTGLYDYMQLKEMPSTTMTYYDYLVDSPRICESYEGKICWEEYFKDEIATKSGWETPDQISFRKDTDYSLLFIKRGQEAWGIGIDVTHFDKKVIKENYVAYVVPRMQMWNFCTSMMRGSSE